MTSLTATPATVEIKGALYDVEVNTASVVLTKLVSGESYTVCRQENGHLSCDCPAHHYRGTCKHADHVQAEGLLPVAPPEDLTFDDFTADASDDLVVAPLSSVEAVEAWPVLPGLRPSYRAKLMASIENELAERHIPVALHAAEVFGDTSDRDFLARLDEQWASIDDQDRRLVREWMDTIGYVPTDGPFAMDEAWWAFTRDCVEGCPVSFAEPSGPTPDDEDEVRALPDFPMDDEDIPQCDEVGRFAPAPDFEPTLEDEREWASIVFGDEDNDPAYDAWVDGLAMEREPHDWHEAERVEAVGALLARVI